MSAIKICPKCGTKNPAKLIRCQTCKESLNGIPIVSGEVEAASVRSAPSREAELYAVGGLVRFCDGKDGEGKDCLAPNPPAARKCRLCFSDISHVIPTRPDGSMPPSVAEPKRHKPEEVTPRAESFAVETPRAETSVEERQRQRAETEGISAPRYYLDAYGGGYSFSVPRGETVIGRAAEMGEYLSTKTYVSRNHCKLILEDGGLYVVNLSRTNYTYCNGARVGDRLKLRHGDELGLGGIVVDGKPQSRAGIFTVRVEVKK